MGGKEPVVAKKPKIIRKKLSPTTAEGHASTSNTTSDTPVILCMKHEVISLNKCTLNLDILPKST